jgi:bifunctional non-homologous end joining protein LigD
MLLGTCAELPSAGSAWVLEPKWDGYRCLARVNHDGVAAWMRHGTPLAARVPVLVDALAVVRPDVVLDGELVALVRGADGNVAQDWDALGALWRDAPMPAGVDLRFVAFDCLQRDGVVLDDRPWRYRRARLEAVVAEAGDMVCATSVHAPNPEVHAQLVALGFEGSVVKRVESRYRRGERTRSWLKLKQRHEAIVLVRFAGRDRITQRIDRVAFTEPQVPGLQWAALATPEVRQARERSAENVAGVIAYSHRSARGAAREARLTALLP